MSQVIRLRGRRIMVLMADGFEMVEFTAPVRALQAAGADVDVVSLRLGRIRGVNLHEPAHRVRVDRLIRDVSPAEYDALFIPGGFINPDLLRQSEEARELVQAFDRSGKPIASLCHGPWVLASAGLTRGRTLTSWPGIRDDLVNAGATWLDQELVRDGAWLTSRGPQDLHVFVPALIAHFAGEAERPSAQATASAPQRQEPPRLMIEAMRWMPRPSFRTIGLGVVAAGAAAAIGLRRLSQ